jgi:hypothetical protein
MCNGAPEGAVTGSLGINVDELVVICCVGKLIDPLLGDFCPFIRLQAAAYVIAEFVFRYNLAQFLSP